MSPSLRLSLPSLALSALLAATASGAPSGPAPRFGTPGAGRGELRSPVAVAPTRDRVYVADFDNDRVQVFTREGEPLLEWGGTGSGNGRFRGPAGIAIGVDGSVYVTDLYNHRIQKFTAGGEFVSGWSMVGDDASPCGIALGPEDRVYVTDLENGRVSAWSSGGTPLVSWGMRGHGHGELFEPWGIAVDASGDVLVADHGNHRVQSFSSEGEYRGEWGETGFGDSQLVGPMGLAMGRDGSVYLTDLVGDRVRRFTREGTLVSLYRRAETEVTVPSLALDPNGELVLAEMSQNQWTRLPVIAAASAASVPAEFALRPIVQMLGGGPVTLQLAIPSPGTLGAEIFSLDGRRVFTVPSAGCEAGDRRITWDTRTDEGRRAPAGLYFVRVQFHDGVRTITRSGRIVVLR